MCEKPWKKVLGNYIVVENDTEPQKTEGGLLLSSGERDAARYVRGRAIGVGVDVISIVEGDVVYYDKGNAFSMLLHGSIGLTLIREADLILVV